MSGDSSGRYTSVFLFNKTQDGRTVYTIKVTSPDDQTWNIQKRYNDFRDLHEEVRLRHGDSLPPMPGKRLFGNQDPQFIAARQTALNQYLDGLLRLEREQLMPVVRAFLGVPQQKEKQNQAEQYHQILDNMQAKLLNLALPPGSIDDTETGKRLKKYGQAMRLQVLSQPVDPIYLRSANFDNDLHLCSTNADQLDALKARPTNNDQEVSDLLENLLDDLQQVLHPTLRGDPDKLVVPFPPCTASS